MAFRIEITSKIADARAAIARKQFAGLGLAGKVAEVAIAEVYTVDARLSKSEREAAARVLANPLTEKASLTPVSAGRFTYAIEIGYLPGVTDNVGGTAKETIEDLLKRGFASGESVYSSRTFFISGSIKEEDARKISDSLYNPLIQRARIKTSGEFKKDGGMGVAVPKVVLRQVPKVDEVSLWVNDEELAAIGSKGIPNKDGSRRGPLALDIASMKAIRTYFHKLGRNPTDAELEALAQTWSEHCKHTIFADPLDEITDGIFKKYIRGATEAVRKAKGKGDFCVSVFTDNAGAIAFDENYLISHKVETHNTPSALDPFGGAITGIVGVNRDALGFGLGAKPVANTYGFCFADPRDERELWRDEARSQKMLSSRRIMEGVVQGINSGGNQSGIPTPQGFMIFDPGYQGKPLVFAGTVGLIPRKVHGQPGHVKKARAGDYIVMMGGRVGIDGIHGATFSSEALDPSSPATAVQIGDPITQKKMSDMLVKEARDKGLYASITDDGAGGLSSSVGEMARDTGGCRVELEKVPLKYPGLLPWQIWISESQERMTLAVPRSKWKEFSALAARRGVEATVIGEFTGSGKCIVAYKGKPVVDIDMEFLHEGRPIRFQESETPAAPSVAPLLSETDAPSEVVLKLLARPNIASTAWIATQYDHEVQAGSVTKPLQGRGRVNAEATVTRPVLASRRGVVLSQGLLPWLSPFDAYAMAAASIDSAVRAAVAAGADPDYLALLDNFCWSSSNDPARLGQLKRAAKACYDLAVAYGTPFVSGKDSMWNDFKGWDEDGPVKISVLPTLLISAIGVMKDAGKAITLDLKTPGDKVYLLGDTRDELAGSEYALMRAEEDQSFYGGKVPKVNAKENLALYRAFHGAVSSGLVASALGVSRGGLAVALAKAAIGGGLGIDVDIANLGAKGMALKLLVAESQGRILATVPQERAAEFEALFKGMKLRKIGEVATGNIVVRHGEATILDISLLAAEKAYRSTFKEYDQ